MIRCPDCPHLHIEGVQRRAECCGDSYKRERAAEAERRLAMREADIIHLGPNRSERRRRAKMARR